MYTCLSIKDLLRPILRQNLKDTDFLASTLWPNNPSLHPPILYGLFKVCKERKRERDNPHGKRRRKYMCYLKIMFFYVCVITCYNFTTE
jgi:hypothetical protein